MERLDFAARRRRRIRRLALFGSTLKGAHRADSVRTKGKSGGVPIICYVVNETLPLFALPA
jgi:hypothetical protein